MRYIKKIEGSKGDLRESELESKSGSGYLAAASGAIGQGVRKTADFTKGQIGRLKGLGSLLNPAVLGAFALAFGKKLIGRGFLATIGALFADEITEFITGGAGSKELKEAIAKGITFASIGSLFGVRFGILAGLFGFIMGDKTDEVWDKVKEISALPIWEDIREWLQTNLLEGLEGIRLLFSGEILEIWKKGLVLETLTSLGLLGSAIFGIGPVLRTIGMTYWLGGKGLKGVKWVLSKLSKLGLAIANMVIPDLIPPNQLLDKNGNPLKGQARKNRIDSIRNKGGPLRKIGNLFKWGARGALMAGSGLASLLGGVVSAAVVPAIPIAILGSLGYLALQAAKNNNIIQELKDKGQDRLGDTPEQREINEKVRVAKAMGSFSGLTPNDLLFQKELERLQQKLNRFESGKQGYFEGLFDSTDTIQQEVDRMLEQRSRYKLIQSSNLENLEIESGYNREMMRESMRQNSNSFIDQSNNPSSVVNQNQAVLSDLTSGDGTKVGLATNG
jgi:hypothetical protein